MIRILGRAALGLAASLLAAVLATGYLTFVRAPETTPEDFLRTGPQAGTETVVVSTGASITHASASGDWVGMLRERLGDQGYEFVNAGNNGDTVADLLDRSDAIIACEPDVVTVLVGTNDARTAADTGRTARDTGTVLEELVARLDAETGAEILLISIPPIGQDPASGADRFAAEYRDITAEVAQRHGAGYIPLNEELGAIIAAEAPEAEPLEFSLGTVFAAGARHYLGRQSWDEIGARSGYVVHSDGVHLNDRGAAVLADLVAGYLAER